MQSKVTNFLSLKNVFGSFISICLLFSLQMGYAMDAERTSIQKDIHLGSQIFGIEDLPDEITVSLYDSESAITPLATQIFPRGKYSLDFEFNKSNGVVLGPIARLSVDFSDKLDMGDDPDNPNRVKEIWAEVRIGGETIGDKTKIPDEAMVKLLLASDASIATYLTLAYEGDGNPITTIYKDLPLASGSSASDYITSMFGSYSSPANASIQSLTSPFWEQSGNNIFYNNGNVGIGTTNPIAGLHVQGGSIVSLMTTGGALLVGEGLGVDEYGGYIWDAANNTLAFATASANIMTFGHYNGTVERMRIDAAGNVGIRTAAPGYTLAVNGGIGCRELTVTTTGWADFVFKDGYNLPRLDDVETFINKNKHLPGIPSEAEVNANGVDVGKITTKLLQKIEELTLYVIDLKKGNNLLKKQLTNIKKQIDGSDLSHR
jgi:hypothetical protein